jgi:hypothetical protein
MPFRMGLSFVSTTTSNKNKFDQFNQSNKTLEKFKTQNSIKQMNFGELNSTNKKGCKSCGQ